MYSNTLQWCVQCLSLTGGLFLKVERVIPVSRFPASMRVPGSVMVPRFSACVQISIVSNVHGNCLACAGGKRLACTRASWKAEKPLRSARLHTLKCQHDNMSAKQPDKVGKRSHSQVASHASVKEGAIPTVQTFCEPPEGTSFAR